MAAATLAAMLSAPNFRLHDSRRPFAVLLSLALCLWLLAFSAHSHADADEFSSTAPSTACSFCLSLPTGAPTPVHAPDVRFVVVAGAVVAEQALPVVSLDFPSSYLSRGPPQH